MAEKKAPPTPSPLVAEIFSLDAQISALKETRSQKASELIKCGPGAYSEVSPAMPGAELRAFIVCRPPKESISFSVCPPSLLDRVLARLKLKKLSKEQTSKVVSGSLRFLRKLAGDKFDLLFDSETVYTPAEGFEALAPKLLPEANARRIVKHCRTVKPAGEPSLREQK